MPGTSKSIDVSDCLTPDAIGDRKKNGYASWLYSQANRRALDAGVSEATVAKFRKVAYQVGGAYFDRVRG